MSDNSNDEQLKCSNCKRKFTTIDRLKAHVVRNSCKYREEPMPIPTSQGKTLDEFLELVMKYKNRNKKVSCYFCGKTYRYQKDLDKHIDETCSVKRTIILEAKHCCEMRELEKASNENKEHKIE